MDVRAYGVVTGAYWAFTVTDGALRMLVLLHFHQLGFSPVALSLLFVLYETLGVVTNFVGGRLGGRFGLNRTLTAGLATQVLALSLLSLQNPAWSDWASVTFVMGTQALSGVAKDLTKLSSKAALKIVVPDSGGRLFRWVAILTGSKNALKGVGFFVGAALLASLGFASALRSMAVVLGVVLVLVVVGLETDIGRADRPRKARAWLSTSAGINRLAAARVFLFASRDVWFVVALPVFLTDELGWSFEQVGAFLALWVIGYGMVQSFAPLVAGRGEVEAGARLWITALAGVTGCLAGVVFLVDDPGPAVVAGLLIFGVVFAVNSSIHSYLVLAYADDGTVAADVGFYYSANAVGRLMGTLMSGLAYVFGGLTGALVVAGLLLVVAAVITRALPDLHPSAATEPAVPRSGVGRARG